MDLKKQEQEQMVKNDKVDLKNKLKEYEKFKF